MKSRTNPAAKSVNTENTALSALLSVALAIGFLAVLALTHPMVAASQSPAHTQPRSTIDLRNRRLLELNEGIAPAPPRAAVNRNTRLFELNEGYVTTPTTVRVSRINRLLELNEGYAPVPVQTPRDLRLFFLNQ